MVISNTLRRRPSMSALSGAGLHFFLGGGSTAEAYAADRIIIITSGNSRAEAERIDVTANFSKRTSSLDTARLNTGSEHDLPLAKFNSLAGSGRFQKPNLSGRTFSVIAVDNTTNADPWAAAPDAPSFLSWAVEQVSKFAAANPDLREAANEASAFVAKLSADTIRPAIWSDLESEIVFEWIDGPQHAVVSFEGEGEFGYALKHKEKFVPGKYRGDVNAALPIDLAQYINSK